MPIAQPKFPPQLLGALSDCLNAASVAFRRDEARARLRQKLECFVHSHPRASDYLHDVGTQRADWWNDTRESRCLAEQPTLKDAATLLDVEALISLRSAASDTLLGAIVLLLEGHLKRARSLVKTDLFRFGPSPGTDGLHLTAGLLAELNEDWENAIEHYRRVCQSERHQYRISALLARAFLHARSGADDISETLRLIASEDPMVVERLGIAVRSTRANREGTAALRAQCSILARAARTHHVRSLSPLTFTAH